ncbi:hypothetical protein RchiOBHm_Chr6g0251491 [Rosa chinensis]|uniref:Uncharacterized protein n=1 Tax=Rosa chinensis TaxID=74649 RepID=A0A2P6PKV4_ROSCH|nr:hypothetical protein RchiOBHm_Chr6g0251491 [Rosa chinensis]
MKLYPCFAGSDIMQPRTKQFSRIINKIAKHQATLLKCPYQRKEKKKAYQSMIKFVFAIVGIHENDSQ